MAATNPGSQDPRSPSYGNSTKDVRDDVDALRGDIASLANSVSKLATEKVGTVVGDAQATAEAKLGDLEAAIRRNPTQSALIAVGVGFLVGLVLTR